MSHFLGRSGFLGKLMVAGIATAVFTSGVIGNCTYVTEEDKVCFTLGRCGCYQSEVVVLFIIFFMLIVVIVLFANILPGILPGMKPKLEESDEGQENSGNRIPGSVPEQIPDEKQKNSNNSKIPTSLRYVLTTFVGSSVGIAVRVLGKKLSGFGNSEKVKLVDTQTTRCLIRSSRHKLYNIKRRRKLRRILSRKSPEKGEHIKDADIQKT